MKKVLFAVVILFVLFWAGTLVLIPGPLIVSSVAPLQASAAKVNSFVFDTANWHKWWPGQQPSQANGYQYTILSQTSFSSRLLAKNGSDTFTSEIVVLPATPDSSIVQWKTEQPASLNPFVRIRQYNRAATIKQHLQLLLDSLSAYANNKERVYGLDIKIINFTNPFMINTQAQFNSYPSVEEVYKTIGKLRAYAQAGGAVPVDSPMVNIMLTDNQYLLRTALPVSKKLDAKNDIGFKQMVLGKTLYSTATGGRHTVENSLLNMQHFISDYRLTSPAIPFELWTTNRQQQPDSSKWITKLYYPIF